MEQARNYVCRSCSSGVPTGHKFCGRCGTAVPPEILSAQTLFFGDMQNPAKAKLILIRGEGMDGLSFHLKALKDAGLVTDRKDGRWVYYALNPGALALVGRLIEELKPIPSPFRVIRRCD